MGFFSKLFGKRDQVIEEQKDQIIEQVPETIIEHDPEPVIENQVEDQAEEEVIVREEGVRYMNKRTYALNDADNKMLEDSFKDLFAGLYTSSKEPISFALGGADYNGLKPYQIVAGWTRYEPDNYYDKTAISLEYYEGGLIMGYILKTDKRLYNKLTGKKDGMPFVGITYEHNGKVQGEILLLKDITSEGEYAVKDVMLKAAKKLTGRMLWIKDHGLFS